MIREPRRIIASYARVRPSFSLEELGFSQQRDLFDRECDRVGAAPPVLDASLTLENPESVLRQLCSALEIEWDEAMLKWPAGSRDSDGVWAPYWYNAVLKSTGFTPAVKDSANESGAATGTEGVESTVAAERSDLSLEQETLCAQANEMYEHLLLHALRP